MILLIALIVTEWLAFGTAILLRAQGKKNWYLALIPFYNYFIMQELTHGFKVLTIPVRKYGIMMIELFIVLLAAYLYERWGNVNLPQMSRESLRQILYLPEAICLFLIWASQMKASMKLFRMMKVERYVLFSLCAATIIGNPLALYMCRKNEIDYSISY